MVAVAVSLCAIGATSLFETTSASVASAQAVLSAAQTNRILNPAPNVHIAPPRATAQRITASTNTHEQSASNSRTGTATNVGSAGPNDLLYHGGDVMQVANRSVPIFWLPPTLQDNTSAAADPNYATIIQQYFQDVAGSGLYGVNSEYYQTTNGPTEYIVNASGLVQAIVDASPYPVPGPGCAGAGPDCLDDPQIRDEITKVVVANALPADLQTQYYVFTAPHESSCLAPTNCFRSDISHSASSSFQYCAYHSFTNINGQYIIYANMPYDATAFHNSCTGLSAFPNNHDADIEISTTSHEQMEATTDPLIFGWFDAAGAENGDKCAYNYGPLNYDGGLANESWNGHFYVLQQEWSNALGGCTPGAPGIVVPSSPTITQTTVGSGWINIAFNAPASSGASSVTGYTATITPGGTNIHVGTAATRVSLRGLTNATPYTVSVTADNAQGPSTPSTIVATPTSTPQSFTTNWSATEYARLTQSAAYLGLSPVATQVVSVYAVAYILGIANVAATPTTPPASAGPHAVTSTYTVADQSPLLTVMQQFAFSPSESQYLSAQLVGFLLALGGH